jgi:hypothetical protein
MLTSVGKQQIAGRSRDDGRGQGAMRPESCARIRLSFAHHLLCRVARGAEKGVRAR